MITISNYNKFKEGGVNRVISVTRVLDEDFILLAEVKRYLKVDFTETENDILIGELIPTARSWAEERTGLSLVPTAATAILQNEISGMMLPWGPYVDSLVLKDTDDVVISADDYTVKGSELFQYSHGELTATYNAGYDDGTLPPNLRTGIKEYIKYLYNPVRDAGSLAIAKSLTAPFITKSWIV